MFTIFRKKHKNVHYFIRSFSIVIAVVLIWRGIWHIIDRIDVIFFAGETLWTAVGGFIIGFMILYFPDKDLKEILD